MAKSSYDGEVRLRLRTDWTDWYGFVKAKLMRKQVWELVSKPGPAVGEADGSHQEGSIASTTVRSIGKCHMAVGIIVETLHPTVRNQVQDFEDPYALMEHLRTIFFRKTPANLSEMIIELYNMDMPASRSIEDVIANIDRLSNDIKAQGGNVDDQGRAAVLHSVLMKCSLYRPIIMIISARTSIPGAEALTYAEVCDTARTYETTLTPAHFADDAAMNAVLLANHGKHDGNVPRDHTARCRTCKEDGHDWRQCLKYPPGTCWKCGVKGHSKRDCPSITHSANIAVATVPESFVVDTGATAHIVNRSDYLATSKPTNCTVAGVHSATPVTATATGTLHDFPGTALLLPNARENILSVLQLGSHGWKADFRGSEASLIAPDGLVLRAAADNSMLYRLDSHQCFVAVAASTNDMLEWHNRLGHIGDDRLREICRDLTDTNQWPDKSPVCQVCIESKLTKAPVRRSATHQESDANLRPGQVLHIDLIGPMECASIPGGNYYELQVKDRATRMLFRAPLVRKTGVGKALADILDREFTPFGRICDRVNPDRGGEFYNKEFLSMCAERGIKVTFTASDTPAHNGLVERAHRTVVAIARSLLNAANLPGTFWSEAMDFATYLSNALPTSGLPDRLPPFFHWTGEMPKLNSLLTFGSKVFFLSPGGRFGKTAAQGIYLGPARDTTGGASRVWNPASERIIVSRDIRVIEPVIVPPPAVPEVVPLASIDPAPVPVVVEVVQPAIAKAAHPVEDIDSDYASETDSEFNSDSEEVVNHDQTQRNEQLEVMRDQYRAARRRQPALEDHAELRRSTRLQHAAMIATSEEPSNYKEAIASNDAESWIAAMQEELSSLQNQKVYEIVERTAGMRCVTSKWVFKVKFDAENIPIRYKSRLAARGFTQLPGIDFDGVSAPVISKEAVRIFFAVAAQRGWKLEQFDVKTAYLYAPLDKTVYMEPPAGFTELWGQQLSPDEQNLLENGGVLRLKKALYGLRQSGRCWYDTLSNIMQSVCNMVPSAVEPCLFVGSNRIALFHVDDGLCATLTDEDMTVLLDAIASQFDIARLGFPRHYTGLIADQKPNGDILLHQRAYINSMTANFALNNNHKVTPMIFGAPLPEDGYSPPGDIKVYREIIGSLLYASIGTRPDITTAVSILSRHLSAPTAAHVSRARHIVSYLAGVPDLGICFRRQGELNIQVYCDASFAPDEHNRRSRTGYVVTINKAPVAWKSQLQSIVAQSTSESEYIALCDAVREAVYVRRVMEAMDITHEGPIIVFEDNQVTKRMAEEVSTRRSKHIDIRYHYVRSQVAAGAVVIKDCRSADMIADLLTKPLPRSQFIALRRHYLPLGQGEC